MSRTKSPKLDRIVVKGLFAKYDYDIGGTDTASMAPLAILYGDNGCGKTTILRLVFHLLAHERTQGHRGFVSRVNFREVSLKFSDGSTVWARRTGHDTTGEFVMGLDRSGLCLQQAVFRPNSEGLVVLSSPDEEAHSDALLAEIQNMGHSLYMLSDDRKVETSEVSDGVPTVFRRRPRDTRRLMGEHLRRPSASEREPDPETLAVALLESSIQNASDWIRSHVMFGSSRGEYDVNVIYAKIAEQVARPKSRPKSPMRERILALESRIKKVASRNAALEEWGFTSGLDGSRLLNTLSQAEGRNGSVLADVLEPYLDSVEARHKALDSIEERTRTLVRALNTYLVDKTAKFNLRGGLGVMANDGQELLPAQFSSGERHLLLLFCNVMTALDGASIFIIDEPEISLNVRWQRRLVGSLLECARGTQVQFVMASHSLEILTKHNNRVVRLRDTQS